MLQRRERHDHDVVGRAHPTLGLEDADQPEGQAADRDRLPELPGPSFRLVAVVEPMTATRRARSWLGWVRNKPRQSLVGMDAQVLRRRPHHADRLVLDASGDDLWLEIEGRPSRCRRAQPPPRRRPGSAWWRCRPRRAPGRDDRPALILSRFVPRLPIEVVIRRPVPWPIETTVTTEATPMMTPSIVSALRSGLAPMRWRERRTSSRRFTPPPARRGG